MKHVLYFLIFSLLGGAAFAQQGFNCSSHLKFQKQLDSDPEFRKNQAELEKATQLLNSHAASKPLSPATYIIPVVFHIIYTTPAGNISDAQVIDQVNILNTEFRRQQPDTTLTPAAFLADAAPFSVEFRLATRDPNGQCTNGINRIYSSLSNCSFEEDDVKSLSYWPSNQYLNIWIVQSMHYSNSMDCVGGGYATFPGGPATLDGINIRGDLISNIGTSASNTQWGNFKGRYLIHELGHWFNLRHIWGDANCGNDLVADTPPAMNSNSGCPSFPRNPNSSCPGSNANGEMFSNYMDYSDGYCLNMFTAGQVSRMTACITSPVSGRSNLWSNANLNATGTNNPYLYPVACGANPDVLPYGKLVVCAGDSVKFTDNSYGGNSSSRLWDFTGGSASSLTDSIVKVKYNTPGTYTVGLTKYYQSTNKSASFINKVIVLDNTPNPNYVHPFSDGFDQPAQFDNDWVVVNHDDDATTWVLDQSTGYLGMNSPAIMNFGKSAPMLDELISPAYNLTSVTNPTLTFRLHFANRITANYDKLTVFISNNCGKGWQQIYTRSASNNLNTVPGNFIASYIPTWGSDDDWRQDKVVILNSWSGNMVRFKFAFTSGGGGNIFIDDINLEGKSTVGVKEHIRLLGPEVFPNPAREQLQVRLSGSELTGTIEIKDVLGRTCMEQAAAGSKDGVVNVDIRALEPGAYFVSVKQSNGKNYSTKFIKYSQE